MIFFIVWVCSLFYVCYICVYVFRHVHMYMYMSCKCLCLWVCGWKPEVNAGCLLLSAVSFETRSLPKPGASGCQASPRMLSDFPALGIQVHVDVLALFFFNLGTTDLNPDPHAYLGSPLLTKLSLRFFPDFYKTEIVTLSSLLLENILLCR